MSKCIDMTGQQYGYWKVLQRGQNNKDGRARWICECQLCGTIKEVDGAHLRSGRSTNCGCLRQKKMTLATIKDRTGQQYGFLKVKRLVSKEELPEDLKKKQGTYWLCDCLRCGNKNVIVKGDYLENGDTKSCGCLNTSFNEENIIQILKENNINFVYQYSFPDLKNDETNYKLRFDFAIFDNNNNLQYLIEYDGSQHFKYRKETQTWCNQDNFVKIRRRDLLKNKYCFQNNIPLIRIPYNKKYEKSDLFLNTTRFLITSQNVSKYYSIN